MFPLTDAALTTAATTSPPQWVDVLIAGGVVVATALTVLFSLIGAGGRITHARSVQIRLRAGIITALVVIVLAALDMFLTLTSL